MTSSRDIQNDLRILTLQ